MKNNKNQIKSYLQRISNILLMNGCFLDNPGLYTGKMGLVLLFFRYARYTQNELYSEYSFDLIEKVQNRIHQETLIDYKQGLAGIGSAIEYLEQNGYIEANTDEILEDFDKRIFFTFNLPYLPVDDILSIGYYVHWRMSGNSAKKEFLQQNILPPIEHLVRSRAITPAWHPLSRKEQVDHSISNSFHISLKNNSINDVFEKYSHNLGIHNGLAGLGMTLFNRT